MNCKTLRDFHIVQADSVSHSRPMSHAAVSPSVIAAVHALRFKMSSTTWPSTAAYPAYPARQSRFRFGPREFQVSRGRFRVTFTKKSSAAKQPTLPSWITASLASQGSLAG